MYRRLRRLLFLADPEKAHYYSMDALKLICRFPGIRRIIRNAFYSPDQPVTVCGLEFKNPVGLAAGFDKNALYLKELELLGFGFIEIGTVTPLPQKGNEKPRLFRLPQDKALINRMGFNNDGMEAIAARLKTWKENSSSSLVIGGNIGKNKNTPNDEAWKDYESSFKKLYPYVDYFVVNVSSPNTPGLRELQDKEILISIFKKIQDYNHQMPVQKPVFLKLSPDLTLPQLDDIINEVKNIQFDGLIIANTTTSRSGLKTPEKILKEINQGGLSGKPVGEVSTRLIQYITSKTNQIPIIASGGIFDGKDAEIKLKAGASLIQVWTGFIYQGPGIVKSILKKLKPK